MRRGGWGAEGGGSGGTGGREETGQNYISKHSVEKKRVNWGATEKHRVKRKTFGMVFKDVYRHKVGSP